MKKSFLLFLKIAVTVSLVLWLIRRVDWGTVSTELQNISWVFLLSYVIVQLTGNVISAKKWQIIAGYKNLSFSVKEGFFVYLTGAFINNFLPSTLGGDAYRGMWLAEQSGTKAAAFSTVVFDRFIGLWVTAFLALLCGILLFPFFGGNSVLLAVFTGLVLFFVADLVLTYAYCQSWFPRLIAQLPFHKLRRFFEEIIWYTQKRIWLRVGLWSLLFVCVGVGLSNYLLFQALGSSVGPVSFLSVIFLVTIVSAVPISINNIGVKEWAYVTFFGLVGVGTETAVTVALLSRFVQMLLSFLALPYYIASKKAMTRTETLSPPRSMRDTE